MFELLMSGKRKFIEGLWRYALFAGGSTGSTTLSITDRYHYVNDAVTAGYGLPLTLALHAGTGNSSVGVFAGGAANGANYSTQTTIYNYAANTAASGSQTLTSGRHEHIAFGNETHGIFALGYYSAASLTNAQKYTYANFTYGPNTSLSGAASGAGAASNLELGIVAGGSTNGNFTGTYNTSSTKKYTHATGVWAAGIALSASRSMLAGAGNATMACFAGGGSTASIRNTVEILDYASLSFYGGNSLGLARLNLAGAGNNEVGIFAGGRITVTLVIANVEKYTYATHAITSGTSLKSIRRHFAAASSSPGWVVP
ncbi:MAG: hypothetical protein PHQ58_04990 [Rhodoferax sp.]|uniref:hypothetical protein n=1 Tax=Rhodoferax sp. TaxID=50421 RepID=UPI0026111D99|nr:hypothetical protein [Rhodoferax sp.]MDD2879770.1 hypothetical protein [Rhodoferax sp.]